MKNKPTATCPSEPDQITELKTLLGYLVTPEYTTDCYIRVDGRLTGKLTDMAKKLLFLLEADYPSPKQPEHCLCCGHQLRIHHE
jgi:hypothetical protein